MTGPCRLYEETCNRLGPARRVYARVAGLLGLPWHRESMALEAAWRHSDPGVVCGFLAEAWERVPGEKVCVLGPLYDGLLPPGCSVYYAVEAPGTLGSDAVFTDRDSRPPPLEEWAAYRYWLVHIHGDNYWIVRPPADGKVIYTSQAYCKWPVIGIGGFTDGDRPVALALALEAGEVVLAGYDTGGPRCPHKGPWACEGKEDKLRATWLVLGSLASAYSYELVVDEEHLLLIHR